MTKKDEEVHRLLLARLTENYRVETNEDEIDERLDALARHVGRELSENEQSYVLDIVDEFMPKNEQGNYTIPLMEFEKAWGIYLSRKRDGSLPAAPKGATTPSVC